MHSPDAEAFILAAMDLEGVTVGHEDGAFVAERALSEGATTLDDLAEAAFAHGLEWRGGEVDAEREVVRVRVSDPDRAEGP